MGLAVGGAAIAGIEIALFIDAGGGPVWLFSLVPTIGLVYLTAGLLAWWWRPSNLTGAIMSIGAATAFGGALANTTVPILSAVGVILTTSILAVVVWMLHAFPTGHLRSTVSRRTVAAVFVTALVLQAPLYLFNPSASPDGMLAVADLPTLTNWGKWIQRIVGIGIMAVTATVLVGRIRRGAPAQRRVLLPLYVYGTVAVLAVPLLPTVVQPALDLSIEATFLAQAVILGGVPLAFLLALLRGGFARTGEVEELGAWLGEAAAARGPLVHALRRTLGDDSLRLVYWSANHNEFVDDDGTPVPLDADRDAAVDVRLGSRRIGAIVYDATVIEDAELVRAAGRVAAIAVDHERLTAELRANQAALQESRARLVEAGDQERRRIAHNLHDGLQVDLVLLALEAQELTHHDGLPHELVSEITRLRAGIDAAARELRELVHAVMPAGLVERGLTAAVEDLVDRMPIQTRLALVHMDGPLPKSVESTAYFVVAEALANAVKHADASALSVLLEQASTRLVIDVADNGVGGASSGRGSGLRGLADRVDVLGGILSIDSPPGHGTHLVAELPCES